MFLQMSEKTLPGFNGWHFSFITNKTYKLVVKQTNSTALPIFHGVKVSKI